MGRIKSLTPRKCLKENCDRKHYAKGYCREHYQQKWYLNKVNCELSVSSVGAAVPSKSPELR